MKYSCYLFNRAKVYLVLGGMLRQIRHCCIDVLVVLAVSLPDVSAGILVQCEFRTHIFLGAHH